MLAVPAGVAVGLIAAGAPPWWQLRGAFASAGVLVVAVLAVRRHRPDLDGYASTGFAAALALVGAAPLAVPGAEAGVALRHAGRAAGAWPSGEAPGRASPRAWSAPDVRGLALLAVAPAILLVFVDLPVPIWSGVPAADRVPGAAGAGLTLLLLGAAAAAYARIGAAGGGCPPWSGCRSARPGCRCCWWR